jgi:hypothetical protein
MATYKIVCTSNYDLDYYDEKFVEGLPILRNKSYAQLIAHTINSTISKDGPDYYKVVEEGYVLRTSDPN